MPAIKPPHHWALIITLLLLLVGISQAADVYVSPGGSGSACTSGSPCSFATGKGQLGPGETMFMGGGNYMLGAAGLPTGTPSAWITIRNRPGEIVRIGDGSASGQNFNSPEHTSKYVRIEGDFVPGRNDGVATTAGLPNPSSGSTYGNGIVFNKAQLALNGDWQVVKNVRVVNFTGTQGIRCGNDNQFLNLEVDHNGGNGGTTAHGVYCHGSRILIDGGFWHDHWGGWNIHLRNSKGDSGKCALNTADTAANPDGCGSLDQIVRNVSMGPTNGGCLNMAYGERAKVYNNTAYGCGGGGFHISTANSEIYHNTITGYNQTNANSANNCGLRIKDNNAAINNIVINGAKGGFTLCDGDGVPARANIHHNLLGNNITGLFVNPGAHDFRLVSGASAAINQGVALSLVPTDKVGAARVGAPDLGAYEFGGSPPACTKPGGDCTPPSVPAAPSLTFAAPSTVNGDWPDSTGSPTGYKVYRCASPTSCTPSTLILSPTTSAFSDTGLVASTRYTYGVTSVDANANESAMSNVASITTAAPPADTQAPDVPTGLACNAPSFNQVSCSWTASADNPTTGGAGTAGYRIQSCQGAACTPIDPFDTSAITSYTKANLTAQQTYGFRVAAFDAASPPNVSAYSGTQYATTPAQSAIPETALLLNSDFTDASGQGHTATPTGMTFDTTNKVEGTAAAFFDAATDRFTTPLTGFLSPNNLTLALSVRPTSFPTGTPPDVRRYLASHSTTPLYANLIQLCMNATGVLQLGLGGSSHCAANANIMQLALNTWYRVVLRLDNGAYTVHVDGVQKAAGSYTGLATFDTAITLGNHLGADQGWRGQMDAVKLVGQVWTEAQIDADCDLYVAGGCAVAPPTFDALVMVSGVMGDGANSANNTRVTVTMQGPTGPDPTACTDLDQFDLRYAGVPQLVATCAITGTSMQLTASTPPITPATELTLTYLPTGQQISLTNSTVSGATDGASLEQRQWLCRRPGTSPTIRWQAPVNTVCGVPSPGLVDVQVDLVWVGTGSSPAHNYALWCDATPDDAIDQGVRLGTEFNQHGTLPVRYASQHGSSLLIADGAAIAPEMPPIGGITAVAGGTMRRQEASNTLPNLAQNQRTEYRFALEFEEGITLNTTFACELRPDQASGRLSSILPARIQVRPATFSR
jgi:fibronectin type 3 domain-containing protein